MSCLITGLELKDAVEKNTFIKGGNPDGVEGIKYDFRLGTRILKSEFQSPVNTKDLSEAERARLSIDPGEVVFVLTEETLCLPADIRAELKPKRKLAHEGIQIMGGLCVDPGYEGFLIIGLHNVSSSAFPIIPGKKLIAATFTRLEGTEVPPLMHPQKLTDFPDELLQKFKSFLPPGDAGRKKEITEMAALIQSLNSAFQAHLEEHRNFDREQLALAARHEKFESDIGGDIKRIFTSQEKIETQLDEVRIEVLAETRNQQRKVTNRNTILAIIATAVGVLGLIQVWPIVKTWIEK